MTRLWPSLLDAVQVVQPETILRWHRAGFRAFWRWKSRNKAGRPRIDRGLRDLIKRMSSENPLWGASRIHGELLMLGFEVAQSTVSKYMMRPSRPRSQTWKTFLQNHAEAIAAVDMCVVPTLTFECLSMKPNPFCSRSSSRKALFRSKLLRSGGRVARNGPVFGIVASSPRFEPAEQI